jgi:helicase
LIESAYRSGAIKVICCTPSLAYGVSTPAFRVIIKSLKRFGSSWGMDWIPVLEYLQFAGRAGRPEFHDDFGEAVAVAKTTIERDEIHARYVLGSPEAIFSKLAVEPVLRTYTLSLIATGFARDKKQLLDFFSKTFWAHQYKDMIQLGKIVDKQLDLLQLWGFIESKKNDFVPADQINSEGLFATLLGRRVAQLYLDPYTAYGLIKGLEVGAKRGASVFGLLHLLCFTLEMRPQLRVGTKDSERVQAALLEHYEELLVGEPRVYDPGYEDFVNSVKTAMFFHDWVDEKSEEQLFELYGVRPGEVYTKIDNADWLLYALTELCPLLQFHQLLADVRKLRVRVQYGAREELLALLQLRGVGRVRARRLFRNGLKDIGDLKKADVSLIAQVIGQKTALSVKKQLGQDSVLKLGKRRGQMGLQG